MPAWSSVSPEKVATPLWAVTVSVPPRVAPPGLFASATVTVPLNELSHVARAVLGGDGQAEAGPGGDAAGRLRRHRQVALGRLDFEGADVDGAVDDPREAGATLVGGQGLAGGGIDGQGVAAGVDGGAAGQEGDGLGRSAVV